MTHTPTPWKVVWKHDTHKVRRDKNGRIIDNVVVPFEDYQYAMHCVNSHEVLVEALKLALQNMADASPSVRSIINEALTLAEKGE